jgi:hypothetical protein
MVKKSILAIAMLGLLATVSLGASTYDPNTGVGTDTGQMKFDNGWPCQYIPVEICKINIKLKVGYFIEVQNCGDDKKLIINLKQVSCTKPGQSFPCYTGCTTVNVRANFEAQLGLKLYKSSPIISSSFGNDNWKAYWVVGDTTPSTVIIAGDGNFHGNKLCVDAWNADIFMGSPLKDNNNPIVGQVAITAVPTATCIPDP